MTRLTEASSDVNPKRRARAGRSADAGICSRQDVPGEMIPTVDIRRRASNNRRLWDMWLRAFRGPRLMWT